MRRFEKHNVLVTGAGTGIGFGICRSFAKEGATVALNDIDVKLAKEAAARINREIGQEVVHPYGCNIADVGMIREMVKDFTGKVGGLHITVANAGITNYGPFLSYTPESFDTLTSVNMRGSYFTAQA